MMGGKHVYRVSYHAGSFYALVEAERREEAVTIAKAHRERKSIFGGNPPKVVREDRYEAVPVSARDIEWAQKFCVGPLTKMPVNKQKGRPRVRKGLAATPTRVEVAMSGNGTILTAAQDGMSPADHSHQRACSRLRRPDQCCTARGSAKGNTNTLGRNLLRPGPGDRIAPA